MVGLTSGVEHQHLLSSPQAMLEFDRASIAEEYVTIIGTRRQGKTTLAIDLTESRPLFAVMCGTEADYGIWRDVVPHHTPVLSDYDADLMDFRGRVVVDNVAADRGIGTAAVHTFDHAIDPVRYSHFVFAFRNNKPLVLFQRSGAHGWMSYDNFKHAHDQATAKPFTALVIDTVGHALYRYKAKPLSRQMA